MLYDQMPTLDIADSCSAPKQRKFESDSLSPNSLLGCLLSQDQSVYCKHTSPNSISSLSDVAFQDTHATVSIPRDDTPKPAAGGPLLKIDSTAQDMIACLHQIFGETDLIEAVDMGPEELRSWESSLMGMDFTTSEFSEDLNDILTNDILSYVEEQLQKEDGLQLANQQDHLSVCIPNVDLQNQTPDQVGQQNFGWSLQSQNQLTPNEGQPQGVVKLSHMDFPQMSSSGFNGSLPGSFQMSSSGNLTTPMTFNPSCSQSQNQQRMFEVSLTDGNIGPAPLRQNTSCQVQTNQMAPATQRFPQIGVPIQNQNTRGPLNPVFIFQGNQWDDWNTSVSNPNQANPFGESLAPNFPSKPSFSTDSSSFSHVTPQTQSNQLQRLRQHVSGPPLNQVSEFQTNPVDLVSSQPTFRSPQTSALLFPDQKDCMFSNTPAALLSNGVQQSSVRLNHNGSHIPSKTPCFYQALPEGEAGMAFTNPKEALLSYQVDAGLKPNCQLVLPQQFQHFSKQSQVRTFLQRLQMVGVLIW